MAAAMLIPSPWTRPPIQAGRPGLATVHPSTFWDLTVRTRLSTFGYATSGGMLLDLFFKKKTILLDLFYPCVLT